MKDISGREFKEGDVIVYFVRSSGGMYHIYGRIEKIEEKRIIVQSIQRTWKWMEVPKEYVPVVYFRRTYLTEPNALIVTEEQVPSTDGLLLYGG